MTRLEEKNHNTKEYYNRVFLNRFDRTGLDYSDSWRVEALLSDYLGGKLIDIGCGVCPLVNKAKGMYNDEVWGVDFADELIERLKFYYPEIDYATCDFNNLMFKDGYFDYAVLGEVIEHSEDPKVLITEALRVLKKGGTLSISVPLDETMENHKYPQHVWSISTDDLKELLPNFQGGEKINNTFICKITK